MAIYYPTAGTIPDGFCPATWQAVLNQFAPLLPIDIDNDIGVIIQEATPSPDDRGKLWIKLLPAAPWVAGAFVWIGDYNDWRQVPGNQVYFEDQGAADAIVLDTGENMTTEAFLENRLFLIKVAAANTGAVTVAVDSIAAKSLYKRNSTELRSGDYNTGQLILIGYDPLQDAFDVLTIFQDPAAPDFPDDPQEIIQMIPSVDTITIGSKLTIPHGLAGVPTNVKVVFVCVASQASCGWVVDDEVELSCAVPSGSTPPYDPIAIGRFVNPIFTVGADDTNIYIISNMPAGGSTYGTNYSNIRIPLGPGEATNDLFVMDISTPKWKLKTYATYIPEKAITVTSDPVAVTAAAGTNVDFSVTVTGDTPITYQWKRNGTDIFDGGRLSGCDTDTLTITGVVDGAAPAGDEANYSCVITNGSTSATSGTAALTVT